MNFIKIKLYKLEQTIKNVDGLRYFRKLQEKNIAEELAILQDGNKLTNNKLEKTKIFSNDLTNIMTTMASNLSKIEILGCK